MILYNITVKLDTKITSDYIAWLQKEHIPDILQTGCFSHAHIFRLLDVDDSDGPTYAIQYLANSKSDYNRYIELHAEQLRNRAFEKWGNRFIAFRSVMELVP